MIEKFPAYFQFISTNSMDKFIPPFYIKATITLLGLLLAGLAIYLLKGVVLPLLFGVIFAILLNPVEKFLERRGLSRIIAITLTVLLSMVLIAAIVYFIYVQSSLFSKQLPEFKVRLNHSLNLIQNWLKTSYGISPQKQLVWFNQMVENGGTLFLDILSALSTFLLMSTVIPVYIFLFLLYRPLLIKFTIDVTSRGKGSEHVREIMTESKAVIQSYMIGVLLETTIVAAMNSVSLLALGIDYAILLGVVGALLNMVPYIGGILGVSLPVLMALVTKDSLGYAMGVVIVYLVIQFIDNHYLIPKVVASKIQVNALVAIVGVLIGNAIGGVAGMFLSLPVIAILKIIFDRIDELKPWGMLLGNEIPTRRPNPLNPALALLKKRKKKVIEATAAA